MRAAWRSKSANYRESGEMSKRKDVSVTIVRGRERSLENLRANAGRGRKKGSQNKVTKEVKEVIGQCFDKIGGLESFAAWARNNRTDFYKLYSKLLPIQLQGTGANGEINIIVSKDEEKL